MTLLRSETVYSYPVARSHFQSEDYSSLTPYQRKKIKTQIKNSTPELPCSANQTELLRPKGLSSLIQGALKVFRSSDWSHPPPMFIRHPSNRSFRVVFYSPMTEKGSLIDDFTPVLSSSNGE